MPETETLHSRRKKKSGLLIRNDCSSQNTFHWLGFREEKMLDLLGLTLSVLYQVCLVTYLSYSRNVTSLSKVNLVKLLGQKMHEDCRHKSKR